MRLSFLNPKKIEQSIIVNQHPHKKCIIIHPISSKIFCLGHEIHITRSILIDMLLQGYVGENDIIFTLKDRMFLYTSLFKNVESIYDFERIAEENKKIGINLDIVDISQYTEDACVSSSLTNYKDFTFSKNYYSENFKNSLLNIHFCDFNYDLNHIGDYVIIHHRYNANINSLKKLISSIHEINKDINIVIFNNNKSLKNNLGSSENLIFIQDLHLYASYLKGYNSKYKCKLFITEWSGGGQLSQYCFNGPIMIHFEEYPIRVKFPDTLEDLQKGATSTNYFTNWDFKNPTAANITMYDDIESLVNNIKNYI